MTAGERFRQETAARLGGEGATLPAPQRVDHVTPEVLRELKAPEPRVPDCLTCDGWGTLMDKRAGEDLCPDCRGTGLQGGAPR